MVIHECSDYTGALQEEEEKEAPLTRLNHTLTNYSVNQKAS